MAHNKSQARSAGHPRTLGASTGQIFSLIHRGEASTIADLCDATGLARSTVGMRVGKLLEHELIVARPGEPSGKGRTAAIYRFNPHAGRVLAAQVGITASRVALTNLDGEIIASEMIDIQVNDGVKNVVGALVDAFRGLLEHASEEPHPLHGIGVGLPNAIELAQHDVRERSNWPELVKSTLTVEFGSPTFVDQDVNLLALAERRVHWPDSQTMICIKAGTVISAGVLVHGNVVRGKEGLTGEIGHITLEPDGELCSCGNRGCLNVLAGGKALAANLAASGHTAATARDVALLARNGVPAAIEQVRNAGRRIGAVLAGAVNLLNPDVITVWGYLAEPEEHLFAGLRETLFAYALPLAADGVVLSPTRLGNDAGIVGASMIVVEHTLSPSAIEALLENVA